MKADHPRRLKTVLDQIYDKTGVGFIFIIDEWDCVFRFTKEHAQTQKAYLDFLRGIFKGSAYVDLAYMTGILPIKNMATIQHLISLMNIL